jgi:hypothetical protein
MFEAAGGNPVDLQRLIHKHCGHAPSLGTVQMWKARKQISREWVAAVVYAHMREGRRAFEFMQTGPPPRSAEADIW